MHKLYFVLYTLLSCVGRSSSPELQEKLTQRAPRSRLLEEHANYISAHVLQNVIVDITTLKTSQLSKMVKAALATGGHREFALIVHLFEMSNMNSGAVTSKNGSIISLTFKISKLQPDTEVTQ